MIKKILSTAILLTFVASATAVAQVNIGYLDTQQVLSELPEREKVEQELNAFIKQKQEEMTQKATEYQDAVAEYRSNRSSMTAQQVQQKEQELSEMQTSLDEFNQSIRLQIQQKQEQLLAPIFERIDIAISEIAGSKDLDFVLNKSTNSGNRVIFYASGNQPDITKQVISQLTSSTQ